MTTGNRGEAASGAFSFRDSRLQSMILFVVVTVSLLGCIYAIYGTVQAEREERAQVMRTSEILRQLRLVGRAALDAETGQRGYLITTDQAYLKPYRDGSAKLLPTVARVETLLGEGGTPRQHVLLTSVRALSKQKLVEMNLSVGLVARHRTPEAVARVRAGVGKVTMDALRANIAELEQIERDILRNAQIRAAEQENKLVPLLFLLLFVLLTSLVLGLFQILRTARIESAAVQATLLADARDRAELLAQELNHRVKNMFAIILSIVRMTSAREIDARTAGDKIAERIHALTMAHEITQGRNAAGFILLGELVSAALAPHHGANMPCTIDGPEVRIAPDQVQSLGLIFHELATNCAKYGACANTGGKLEISWTVAPDDDSWLELFWLETGFPSPTEPKPDGFGSQMMRASARQIGGSFTRSFDEKGMLAKLTARL